MIFLEAVAELRTYEQIATAEDIFQKYKNAMFQTAYRILRSTDDAEEAVGDTLIKICRNIDRFITAGEKERCLLVRKYTEHTAIDKWRERKRKPAFSLDDCTFSFENLISDDTADGSILSEGEEFGNLDEYVNKLPKKYRDILILKYVNEMKNKEIAELMNIPESTVSTQISRTKSMLRKMIEANKGGK